ncbi:MAG TPA: ABC transporter permease subunit [Thermoleophilia bacterium]|nr:ABC transporter permease subunit [Thermoleophilia bacterium]HQG02972.1 ABC transporter permease subunit [Thermoleophilia bacterium]HQJ98678.1 ABC transporter permease subunit [Thermoleophilia bacterium]
MLRDPFLKGLRDQRRSLAIWAASVSCYVVMMCSLFPSIRESAGDLQGYIDSMPEAFRKAFMGASTDFGDAVTYLNGELFSFMTPLLLIAFGIAVAAAQIAGEEESGTLGLLLAYPVSRARLLAQKYAVLVTGTVVLCAAHLAAMSVADVMIGLGLPAGDLVGAHVMLLLLALAVATVAFAVGAATGKRGLTIAIGAALGVVAYLLNIVAQLVQSLLWLQKLSLFYYYGGAEPLRLGLQPANAVVLLLVTAVAGGVAWFAFARRDVHV